MTYDAQEISVAAGSPIELYTLAVGDFTRRYNSGERTETIDSEDYAPIPISRTDIRTTNEDIVEPLEIRVPADNEFALKYLTVPPGQEGQVFIDRFHRDDPDTEVQRQFVGSISAVKWSEDFSEAIIGAFWTTARHNRTIGRFNFGRQCGFTLGDPTTCKVDLEDAAFKHTGQAASILANVLTVSGISGTFDDGWFDGGVVRTVAGDDRRMILSHVGNELTLLLPFHASILGTNIEVRAGCDHLVNGHCATKFDNVENFGGWPFILNNPFEVGVD